MGSKSAFQKTSEGCFPALTHSCAQAEVLFEEITKLLQICRIFRPEESIKSPAPACSSTQSFKPQPPALHRMLELCAAEAEQSPPPPAAPPSPRPAAGCRPIHTLQFPSPGQVLTHRNQATSQSPPPARQAARAAEIPQQKAFFSCPQKVREFCSRRSQS